ncbi:MAG: cytochrome C [Deltaproteobacteria bacterium]|nr:cytochrome C [Deltaproteobacteria bacterium]
MTQKKVFKTILVISTSVLCFILSNPKFSIASDVGNCLLCHKYPGLSRVEGDKGILRLLYVNESAFNISMHAKVKCEGCHTDIKKIPHDPAKKVDCLTQCHIIEPTSEKKFSHKDVADFLAKSVHGKFDKTGQLKKFPEDRPYCKDCHDNPLYRPVSFNKRVTPGISEQALGRCRVCHKKDDFIYRFYNHVTTRLHRSRNPKNITEVCVRCHDDIKLVKRHNLSIKAVETYKDSFHGKAAEFLDERIPDCLDCHVNRGESVHQMLSKKNSLAPTHENNKYNTCSNVECHTNASPKLAQFEVHAEFNKKRSPKQYYFQSAFIVLTGGTLLPLLGIMLLDLLRRLLPGLSRRRK